jgi:hypothetical protein
VTTDDPRPSGTACYAAWSPLDDPESPLPSYVLHGPGCDRPDTHMLRDTGEGWTSIGLTD